MQLPEVVRNRAEQLLFGFCVLRAPENARDQYRLEFRVRGTTVTLYECYAPLLPGQVKWSRVPSAQFRYDPGRQLWTLYWADRNCTWHVYDDVDPSPDLVKLLVEVNADPTGIFFG